jgi:hypothetical protein
MKVKINRLNSNLREIKTITLSEDNNKTNTIKPRTGKVMKNK